MRIRSIETSDQPCPVGQLSLTQQFSHRSERLRGALLASSGALLGAPFALVVTAPAGRDAFALLTTADPISAAQLSIAALLALTALGYGMRQLVRPVIKQRVINIDQAQACVEDIVRHRRILWHEQTDTYRGVRHRVMTTSEGAIHTLTLEHRQPSRSLLIAYQTHIGDEVVQETAKRFGLPVLADVTSQSQSAISQPDRKNGGAKLLNAGAGAISVLWRGAFIRAPDIRDPVANS